MAHKININQVNQLYKIQKTQICQPQKLMNLMIMKDWNFQEMRF